MADDPEQDVERWEAQLRKGTLELAILASLSGARLYGLEILRVLEARAKLGLAEGTLYLILSRLRRDELVEAEWVDTGSGHPRKYYWLSPKGSERLRRMARFWVQFSAGLDATIAPVLKRRGDGDVR